jgi:hypothetical protein
MQCGGFVFQWRCCSRVGSGDGGAPEPYTCPTCTSNFDGMLIREQMLHEDPETPWLCKVRLPETLRGQPIGGKSYPEWGGAL